MTPLALRALRDQTSRSAFRKKSSGRSISEPPLGRAAVSRITFADGSPPVVGQSRTDKGLLTCHAMSALGDRRPFCAIRVPALVPKTGRIPVTLRASSKYITSRCNSRVAVAPFKSCMSAGTFLALATSRGPA